MGYFRRLLLTYLVCDNFTDLLEGKVRCGILVCSSVQSSYIRNLGVLSPASDDLAFLLHFDQLPDFTSSFLVESNSKSIIVRVGYRLKQLFCVFHCHPFSIIMTFLCHHPGGAFLNINFSISIMEEVDLMVTVDLVFTH